MRFRLNLWMIQAKIAALLVAEGFLLDPVLILIVYLLVCCALIESYLDSLRWKPLTWFILVLLATAIRKLVRFGSEEPVGDQPQPLDLGGQPDLRDSLWAIASEVRCARPRHAALVLSPGIWRAFGCDPASVRTKGSIAVIPIGCLALWSIFDFRCYIAHSLVRRRPVRWFGPARRAFHKLNQERYQNAVNRRTNRRARMVEQFVRMYANLLNRWELLVDVDADRRIAASYGASTVADWLQRYYLAAISVPACLSSVIEPAAKRGQLLPIAESCRLYHSQMEPNWLAALRDQMTKAEHAAPGQMALSPVVVRLGALQNATEVTYANDPRPALTLFQAFDSIEESTLRNELGTLPPLLQHGTIPELGVAVLIPQMQEEIARNAKLLAGRSLPDIPDLLRQAPTLADSYSEDRRYLLAQSQRQAMIPHLLAAFLATELIKKGCPVNYTVEGGLIIWIGPRPINPYTAIRQLTAGAMSDQEFLAMIAPWIAPPIEPSTKP